MGYNTTLVVINDALDQIANDPEFGKKLASACLKVAPGSPVDVPAGNHTNAATVIETHHADDTALIAVGGNYGYVVNTKYGDPLDLYGICKRFVNLNDRQQEQVRARFLGAGPGDGHIYQLTGDGMVLCRRKPATGDT